MPHDPAMFKAFCEGADWRAAREGEMREHVEAIVRTLDAAGLWTERTHMTLKHIVWLLDEEDGSLEYPLSR